MKTIAAGILKNIVHVDIMRFTKIILLLSLYLAACSTTVKSEPAATSSSTDTPIPSTETAALTCTPFPINTPLPTPTIPPNPIPTLEPFVVVLPDYEVTGIEKSYYEAALAHLLNHDPTTLYDMVKDQDADEYPMNEHHLFFEVYGDVMLIVDWQHTQRNGPSGSLSFIDPTTRDLVLDSTIYFKRFLEYRPNELCQLFWDTHGDYGIMNAWLNGILMTADGDDQTMLYVELYGLAGKSFVEELRQDLIAHNVHNIAELRETIPMSQYRAYQERLLPYVSAWYQTYLPSCSLFLGD